jgi:hypothetical protein
MSVPVALTALAERIDEFGTVAYLVTVGEEASPHVVSVRVAWDEDRLAVGAGRRTSANVQPRPDVTLLWPAPPGSGYSLIVDGRAVVVEADGETSLAIRPVAAVLHRTPEGDPSAPSCVTVLAAG